VIASQKNQSNSDCLSPPTKPDHPFLQHKTAIVPQTQNLIAYFLNIKQRSPLTNPKPDRLNLKSTSDRKNR
jgi:hypothetical protein